MSIEVFASIIRQAVIAGQSDLIRDLLLNQNQLDLIKCIETRGEMTAHRLALIDDISIQNASAKLQRLYRSGYIGRRSRSAESGGIEYVYTKQSGGADA